MPGQGQGPLEVKAAVWSSGVVRPPLGTWQAVQGCLSGYAPGMRCVHCMMPQSAVLSRCCGWVHKALLFPSWSAAPASSPSKLLLSNQPLCMWSSPECTHCAQKFMSPEKSAVRGQGRILHWPASCLLTAWDWLHFAGGRQPSCMAWMSPCGMATTAASLLDPS